MPLVFFIGPLSPEHRCMHIPAFWESWLAYFSLSISCVSGAVLCATNSVISSTLTCLEEGEHVLPCWLLPPSPEDCPLPPAFMGTGAAPVEVLITNGTAGSQASCACLVPLIRSSQKQTSQAFPSHCHTYLLLQWEHSWSTLLSY